MEAHLETEIDGKYFTEMQTQGVLVVEKKITPEKIIAMTEEINKIRAMVQLKISTMDRPLRTYSDIAERQLGRLDFRCGFKAQIFNMVAEPIVNLIQKLSPKINFNYYWGAIPSLAGSGPTDMHRDIYPILNTTKGMNLDTLDIQLPSYYFTVLIPLVEITKVNGPTEFIKGSLKKPIVNVSEEEIFAPLLTPGDIVIFDGRTMHRGSANKSEKERLIAYITFIANWYHDQTFVINDYLFPELL